MNIELIRFGEIEIDGTRYDHDVVIDGGAVGKRRKKASKAHRAQYGHTPLSAGENIPWGGPELVVGTGTYGGLPIMPEVEAEARRRGIRLTALPTPDACALLRGRVPGEIHAVLHVTC
jgi:hypothetical protein